jgi:hypothetical protein
MIIKILTYVGTILIAFEFVREFTDFQALATMTAFYPFLFLWKKRSKLTKKLGAFKIPVLILILIAALVLTTAMLPITIVFYILWCVILILDAFHRWVNQVYSRGWRTYGFVVKPMMQLSLLPRSKRDDHRTEQRIQENLEKRKVRIIPIMGLVLLTTAFVMELLFK